MKRRPFIFICSPCRGNDQAPDMKYNLLVAEFLARIAVENGGTPVVPHLFYRKLLDDTDPLDRETGLEASCRMLTICDGVAVHPVISEGMRTEIHMAKVLGIPVMRLTEPFPASARAGILLLLRDLL